MILLDTSFIVSYFNTEDLNHKKAKKIMEHIQSGVYGDVGITDYIFDETTTVLLARLKELREVKNICETLKKIIIAYTNPTLFDRTWKLFINQKKPYLSFTDNAIIATVEAYKIDHIATFDKAFEKISTLNIVA